MHVLGLELVELRERLRHRRVPAAEVEAHGVLRGRRRDDDRRVAGIASDPLELVRDLPPDARCSVAVRDVEERELREPRSKVEHDDPDPDEAAAVEGPERDRAVVVEPLAGSPLRTDRVLAVSFQPRVGAPVALHALEPLSVLDQEGVDPLGAIDLTDSRELGPVEAPVHDLGRVDHGAPAPTARQTEVMRAIVLDAPGGALRSAELPDPVRGPGQSLLRVRACGVCRTDLHIADGELTDPKLPLVLGHQIVGEVLESAGRFAPGARVGVPWLGWTCGACRYCVAGQENLCDSARFTGYDLDGGLAELAVADERFCFPIPEGYADDQAAPLLCAGLIGYRSLRFVGDAERLGLYGFGASAHIVCQIAVVQGREVFAGTRADDDAAQAFARSLGASWAGDAHEGPPEELDAVIFFAPAGELVPAALGHVRKGGVVVCAGIYMSDIPSFPYDLLWGERVVRSVANLTRADGEEFLALAPTIPVRTEVETFPLESANEALERLRRGEVRGAAVLVPAR